MTQGSQTKRQRTVAAIFRDLAHERFERFTISDLVDEYISFNADVEMAANHFDGSREGKPNLRALLHNEARQALRSWTDRHGHRYYIHEATDSPGSLWFHRKDATRADRIRFGKYLIEKGGTLVEEGKYHVKEGRKRLL